MTGPYADTYAAYRSIGWHPLPTAMEGEGAGKRPAVRWEDYQDRQPSEELAKTWTQLYRTANVGTTTGGGSGLLVLDFDKAKNEGERDGNDFFNEIKDKLPHTPMAITGKGRHVFFKYPEGWHIPNAARDIQDAEGRTVAMDIRGEGGFIVLPPSLHLDSGKRYEWAQGCSFEDVDLAECPAFVLDLIKAMRGGTERTATRRSPAIEGDAPTLREGARNDTLASMGGKLRRAGLEYPGILAALEGFNAAWCDPPLDPAEVQGIAKSMTRYEKGTAGEYAMDDSGNADYVTELHGMRIRYDPEGGEWWAYNGKYWQTTTEDRIKGLCESALLQRQAEIVAMLPDELEDNDRKAQRRNAERKARAHFAAQLGNHTRWLSCLRTLTGRPALYPPPCQDDLTKLCTTSGIVDLLTGELYDHTPEEWHIRCTHPNVPYDPDAECPEWMEFLETLPKSEDKKDLIPYLKRAIGYTLCGGGREHVLHVLHGPPRSGKGTFLNTLQAVLGSYAVSIGTRAILTQRWASNGPTPDLARLPGARFARMSETSRGQQMDTALVKQLTGGDPITARGAYAKNVVEFTPVCGWWLDTNELPHIASRDSAVWGRLRVIECPHSHVGDEDTTLKDRLMLEAPGILAWCIEGAREYLALESHKMSVPECVAKYTEGERDAQDSINGWLEDGDKMDGKGYTYAVGEIDMPYSDLYRDYKEWCVKNGLQPMGRNTWGQDMTDQKRFKFKKYAGPHNVLYLTDAPGCEATEEWVLENNE